MNNNILKSFDQNEKILLKLLPSITILNEKIPALSHCIGKNRLLGEYYSIAITEIFKIKQKTTIIKLNELCILLRSYIVLDDYLRDLIIPNQLQKSISKWNYNIREKSIEIIIDMTQSNLLWIKYDNNYKMIHNNFSNEKIYDAVLKKCSFLFIPLELNKGLLEFDIFIKTKKFVEYFLFSLQLLDDYKDMEEDINDTRINHNIFISNLDENNSIWLLNHKHNIAKALIKYIYNNLLQFSDLTENSNTISLFYNHSLHWLKKVEKAYKEFPLFDIFHGPYENFSFDFYSFKKSDPFFAKNIPCDVIISAESMHTI